MISRHKFIEFINSSTIVVVTIFLCFSSKVFCESLERLTTEFQAVLFAKTLVFYTNSSPQVSVLVIGTDNDFVNEVKKIMAKSKIKEIKIDTKLPVAAPDIIFLADPAKLNEVLAYTAQKRILSATSYPDLVKKGIGMGVGMVDAKPRVVINKGRAEKENVRWNPALLSNPLTIIADK